MEQYHGTTILSVRRGNKVALGGDGQVTLGNIVIKASARKVRRLYSEKILAGVAGGTDVLEPELGIVAIGSGGAFAQAAASALLQNTELSPADIVKKSLSIAGDICIYTNQNHIIETLD